MHLHTRFLAFKMAVFTAIAGMLSQNTPEWEEAYKRRLFCEMRMNLMEAEDEQTAMEEVQAGADPISTGYEGTEEAPMVLVGEVVNEPQTSQEAVIPGMASFCEAMVEAEDPRTPLAAETESYSQSLAQRAESEVVNEQTASEEAPIQQPSAETQAVETVPQSSAAEAETERPTEAAAVYTPSAPLYLVEGEQLDPGVAEHLYQRLCEAGIGWFYEYALCLAYQESSFNPLAENVNGRDKGLYQFRIEFHPGLAWQNPYAQTDLFVTMMAARAAAGCDVYSMISRHNTSDYCPEINPVYLTQVLSHLPTLQRIR